MIRDLYVASKEMVEDVITAVKEAPGKVAAAVGVTGAAVSEAVPAHATGVDLLNGSLDFATLATNVVYTLGLLIAGAIAVWGFWYAIRGAKKLGKMVFSG